MFRTPIKLVHGESLVLDAKFHWMPFVGAWAMLIAAALSALMWASAALTSDRSASTTAWAVLAWVLGPVGAYMLVTTWISLRRRRLVVTTERVVGQKGVFAVKEINTFFNGVDSVQVDQSLLGRLFDYGLISIYWGRGEHPRRFFNVCKPRSVAGEIMKLKTAHQPAAAAHEG